MELTEETGALVSCPGCGEGVDRFGDHLLCCPRNNYTRRHQSVQGALGDILTQARHPWSREEGWTERGVTVKPADLLVRMWTRTQHMAIDGTVKHGWQKRHQTGQAEPPGREKWRSFLVDAEVRKHEKYDAVCRRADWLFRAMAFGCWSSVTLAG